MFTMLVVEDEYLVRTGIIQTIDWTEYGIQIAGEAGDGQTGLELALLHRPDIIVTDIRMPFMDGLEFMDKIRESGLKSAIIVMSGYDEFDYVRTAMHNGAYAYLLKPVGLSNLTETVRELTYKLLEERKVKKYYENLEQEMPAIRQQFLLNLVHGNLTDENEITEKRSFTNAPICKHDNIVIVVHMQDNKPTDTEKDNSSAIDRKEILSHIKYAYLFSGKFSGTVIESGMDEWTAILHPQLEMGESSDIADLLQDIGKNMLSKLKTNYKVGFSAGISTKPVDITGIHRTYVEASLASRKKSIPGKEGIIFVNGEDVSISRREIRKAMEYIKVHYKENITVDKLAKELFISPSHLMYLFRVELNKTFNECLIEYRIEAAKELLKNPQMKIYEVCALVGYEDAKYFSQLFKRHTGCTPSEYIKNEG